METMTSNRKQFTVTREMLTAVARHLSITRLFVFHRFDPFALLYNKSLNDRSLVFLESQCLPQLRLGKHRDSRETKFTVPLGTSHQVFNVAPTINFVCNLFLLDNKALCTHCRPTMMQNDILLHHRTVMRADL